MNMKTLLALAVSAVCSVGVAQAHEHNTIPKGASIEVKVQQLDPVNGNKDVGTVTITESNYGLVFTPDLQGLKVYMVSTSMKTQAVSQKKKKVN